MYDTYIGNFIIGGIIAILLFYFSKQQDSIISAIIVSIPIFFIIGYLFLHNNNGNINNYIINTSYLWLSAILMLTFIYVFSIKLDNKIIALILGLLMYIFIIFILYDKNILKR